jgi:hypothetical protein
MRRLQHTIRSPCTQQPFFGSDVTISNRFKVFTRFASILVVCFLVLVALLPQTADAALIATSPRMSANFTSAAAEQQTTSINIIVILAEFSDIKHSVSREVIERRIFSEVRDYYLEASYGKVVIAGDVTRDWIALPTQFSSYGNLNTFQGIQAERFKLAFDVIRAADTEVDFKKYGQAIIVLPNVSMVNYALWQPILTNDACSVSWTTVQKESMNAGVFAHELGHALGLPDLYDYTKAEYKSADIIPYVGNWCLMSSSGGGVHFCGFSKMLLGWIPIQQIKTVSPGSTEFVTLEPLEITTGGTKLIKIPSPGSGQAYYLVEARRRIGFDKVLPDDGVLVTRVDEALATKGSTFIISGPLGFVQVQDAEPSTGSLNDATFDIKSGKKSIFMKRSDDIAVVVLGTRGNAYEICVTTPGSAEEISKVSSVVNQAKSKTSQAKFESPEAQSLLKEADNRYTSAIDFLKTQNYQGALKEADIVTSLIDKAISAQGSYAEVTEVMTRAKDAIQKAESEGRTYGLDEAKNLLQQAQSTLDVYEYNGALIQAIKAKKIAQMTTRRLNPLVMWIMSFFRKAPAWQTGAEFEGVSLNVTPQQATTGQEITIVAKIANIGNAQGTYTAILTVNETQVEKKDVTISSEGIQMMTFNLSKDTGGTYTIKVGELSKALVVKKLVAKELELKYDLGVARVFLSAVPGGGYLIDFVPPATPFKVNKVRIFGALFGSGWEGKEFEVAILDKNKEVLHNASYPVTKFPEYVWESPRWVELEVPNIKLADQFYIYVYTGTGRLQGVHIGADDSGINQHCDIAINKAHEIVPSGWLCSQDQWYCDKSKVNWMIRVVGTTMVMEE